MKILHRDNNENRQHYVLSEQIDYELNPKFLYAGIVKPKNNWSETPHDHDFLELLFIKDGLGEILIEDTLYPVKSGDLIIYNAGVTHCETSSTNKPLKFYFVAFENIKIKELEKNHMISSSLPKVFQAGYLSELFSAYFERMLNEISIKSSYYIEIVNCLLRLIVVTTFRVINTTLGTKEELSNSSIIIDEAKKYIDSYFLNDLTVDKIANACFINKYYLVHLFKKKTGMTLYNYIHQKRIDFSKELLLTTEKSITEISDRSGFNNLNYFCRLFKKITGKTPSEFRLNGN